MPYREIHSCSWGTGGRMFGFADPSRPENDIVALVHGDPAQSAETLVRIHSECRTGEVFDSGRCDCRAQLETSIEHVRRADAGVLLYVLGHEGRGIGLIEKIGAYALQDEGRDTFAANEALGLPVDCREFDGTAEVLLLLGVRRALLLTRNPSKAEALVRAGIDVTLEPLDVGWTAANVGYVHAKLAWFSAAIE